MISKVFSVYDKQVEAFTMPFVAPAAGHAIRDFTEAVNAKSERHQTNLSRYPKVHVLYYIGEFNDATGELIPLKVPQALCSGIDVLEKNQLNDWQPKENITEVESSVLRPV